MKINCAITISRPSYGTDKKAISICLADRASGIEFFDGEISLEEFSEALTGLSDRSVEAEVRGLEYIGKKRVTESREILCPLKSYDRKEFEAWLEENAQEEGWILSTHLGSQKSITHNKDDVLLRYSVTKYVEPTLD